MVRDYTACGGGTITVTYEYDYCGETLSDECVVPVEAASAPTFSCPLDIPAISCTAADAFTLADAPAATYSNGEGGNCEISGDATAVSMVRDYTACGGGTITVTYEYDYCGETLSDECVVPVEAASAPTFSCPLDIPAISCTAADAFTLADAPAATYSNGEGGNCEISGDATAVSMVRDYTACGGGTITVTYEYDYCGETLSDECVVPVEAASAPTFSCPLDIPAISCTAADAFTLADAPAATYSNGEGGNCEISGDATAVSMVRDYTACGGGTITVTYEYDYCGETLSDECVVPVEAASAPTFSCPLDIPAISCTAADAFTLADAPAATYSNGEGGNCEISGDATAVSMVRDYTACGGGTITVTYEYDYCGETLSDECVVPVEAASAPTFSCPLDIPAISCTAADAFTLADAPAATYSNGEGGNCEISGDATAVSMVRDYTACGGGTITVTYEYDYCGETLSDECVVPVEAASAPTFSCPLDIPAISCTAADAFTLADAPAATYSNGEGGNCEISGDATAVSMVRDYTACGGGTITVTYEYDYCGETLSDECVVPVEAASAPTFSCPLDIPAISCTAADAFTLADAPAATYSNGEGGNCEISGDATAVSMVRDYTACGGGTITVTYEYDYCGETLSDECVVPVEAASAPTFSCPLDIPAISCTAADAFTLADAPAATYSNGEGGNCEISGDATAVSMVRDYTACGGGTITVTYEYDYCGETLSDECVVPVEAASAPTFSCPLDIPAISCTAADAFTLADAPAATYSNGEGGNCEISGDATAVSMVRDYTACGGGTITVTYEYDYCGETLSDECVVPVEAASAPTFSCPLDIPAISCTAADAFTLADAPAATYSNGEGGNCEISGDATAVSMVRDYTACGGGTITVTYEYDYCGETLSDECVVPVEAASAPTFSCPLDIPAISCTAADAFTLADAPAATYSNGEGGNCEISGDATAVSMVRDYTACGGGTITVTYEYDYCGETLSDECVVPVEAASAPTFSCPLDIPAISCTAADAFTLADAPAATYSNGEGGNCEISGDATAVSMVRDYTACGGGTITVTYEYDYCGETLSDECVVPVEAASAPTFSCPLDIPAISCTAADAFTLADAPAATYSNGEGGNCEISGDATAVSMVRDYTACGGGTITVTYEYDYCGETLSDECVVPVEAASAPTFSCPLDIPAISCTAADAFTLADAPAATYSNGEGGNCEISGDATAVSMVRDYTACGGGTITVTYEYDYCGETLSDECVVPVEAASAPTFSCPLDIPAISCTAADAFTLADAPAATYSNGEGGNCEISGDATAVSMVRDYTACGGGTITVTYEYDYCGETLSDECVVPVEAASAPTFSCPLDIPAISCTAADAFTLADAPAATYSNGEGGNCEISGDATAVSMVRDYTACGGGTITVTYEYDYCGETLSDECVVPVEAASAPTFSCPLDIPAISCTAADAFTLADAPAATYSNGEGGNCEISGDATAVSMVRDYTACGGGTITVTYEYDYCGETLSDECVVPVEAASAPTFSCPLDIPAISCTAADAFTLADAPAATYSNGEGGNCEISGDATAVSMVRDYTACGGGTITVTYEYDYCGETLSDECVVPVEAASAPTFSCPLDIPAISCTAADAFTLADAPAATYSNGEGGNCEISGDATAVSMVRDYTACGGGTITVTYEYDYCGETLSDECVVPVEAASAPTFSCPLDIPAISCTAADAFTLADAPAATYSNGEGGNCEISGDATAVSMVRDYTACGGGTITVTYELIVPPPHAV